MRDSCAWAGGGGHRCCGQDVGKLLTCAGGWGIPGQHEASTGRQPYDMARRKGQEKELTRATQNGVLTGRCDTTAAGSFRESQRPRTAPRARRSQARWVARATVTGREAAGQPGGQGPSPARGRPRVSDAAWHGVHAEAKGRVRERPGHGHAPWLCPQGGARSSHNPGAHSAP